MFETDEHNQYFLAPIKIHEAFIDEDAYLKKIGKERDAEAGYVLENVLENVPDLVFKELTERQRIILDLIGNDSTISGNEMSQKIGVTLKTIQNVWQKQFTKCNEHNRKDTIKKALTPFSRGKRYAYMRQVRNLSQDSTVFRLLALYLRSSI